MAASVRCCLAASAARTGAEEAQVLAADAQAAADARAAELRVAQDSLRTMREECNERWVSSFVGVAGYMPCKALLPAFACLSPDSTTALDCCSPYTPPLHIMAPRSTVEIHAAGQT